MKTIFNLFCAGVLLSGLCAGFVGCNEPKSPGQSENDMLPVSVLELPDDVSAFFEKYLPVSNYSRPPVEFSFGDNAGQTVCLMINSTDEFEAVAPPSAELPTINFEKYTLIIGCHEMGDPGYRLEQQSADVESDVMKLNLTYRPLEGGSPGIIVTFYYWGLYPKLPQKPITVNVKETNRTDTPRGGER